MSTSAALDVRTLGRYCRRFDGRRLGSLLAADAQLDFFGRRVAGRREIEQFVSELPATRHELAAVRVQPLRPETGGDDTALPHSECPAAAAAGLEPPAWDSDENSMDVRMPQTPPRTPPRAAPADGPPRTPENPIPVADDILNAPRAPKRRRRRLHVETVEKVNEMAGVMGDVTWTEAVGRLAVGSERDDDEGDDGGSFVKTVKLRMGTVTTGDRVRVVGVAYFDMMSCRKRLSFRDAE